ncbi:MAG TPA: hypothetical protein VFA98_06250 [Thermoanaerobaculia bacterium]|jgi:hypothetical protein|nr:hypothetical protein [Thermoanaerobaculia bacterium]
MTEYKRDKVQLTEKAVIKRVNRFLAERGRKLLKNHPPRAKGKRGTDRIEALGVFYIVSDKRVVERDVDLEAFARKHEIIASYEVCAPA